jgi:hypothetical protein
MHRPAPMSNAAPTKDSPNASSLTCSPPRQR